VSDEKHLNSSFAEKVLALRRRLQGLESAVVAFSGGVDSALLTVVAFEELKDRMIAILGVSPSVPQRDRRAARAFCERRMIPFQEINTEEFRDPQYLANPHNRCFFCKQSLYQLLRQFADKNGYHAVIDGTNISDISGHRPGREAARKEGVLEPFIEVGFTKDDIRTSARELQLEMADKPAMACLASRVETNIPVVPELLVRIDDAENFLRDLGCQQVRVRHHGVIARIEVPVDEMEHLFHFRNQIIEKFRLLGWQRISLDLQGYGVR